MYTKKPQTSVRYAITHTIAPILSRCCDDITQYDHLHSQFNEIKLMNMKMTLVCEYHKSGNLHYHGIAEFDIPKQGNIMNKYRQYFKTRELSKFFGFMEIKQIDNPEGWLAYISKNMDETYDLIERRRHPIIRDDLNLFNLTKWNINTNLKNLPVEEEPESDVEEWDLP